MKTPDEKELRALDALIAGAMLPEINCSDITKEKIDALVNHCANPLPEDVAALENLGNPFAEGVKIPRRVDDLAAVGEMVVAMNRKNASDQMSEQTRAELQRKARELLG